MNKNIGFKLLVLVSFVIAAAFLGEFSLIPELRAQTPKKESDGTVEFWMKQRNKALETRKGPVGPEAPGVVIPPELMPDDVVKENAKIRELAAAGFKVPLDYAELAEKRSKGELVELPMATETFVLDVGGNTTDAAFTSFDFDTGESTELKPDSSKLAILKNLADDFGGNKYDLNVPGDRRQIKIRLLRMLNPEARAVLEEISLAYYNKFKRPLRITSLVRSMEYQVGLSKFRAKPSGSDAANNLGTHSSGFAFDLGYKQMTAEEQNFVMKIMAGMEKKGRIDALREAGDVSALHVFVYKDGKPPKA